MSAITTHVLDTAQGRPAVGVEVQLERRDASDRWTRVGGGTTDSDGRLRTLVPADVVLAAGDYRLVFDTGGYFARTGAPVFYPAVTIVFTVASGDPHYHVPLLLSPFGYSTYRGS